MRASDIRILAHEITFTEQRYRTPFLLSSGSISSITYAQVTVTVENRNQQRASGKGGVLLSDVWSFPGTKWNHSEKDQMMRKVMHAMGRYIEDTNEYDDPLQLAAMMDSQLEGVARQVTTSMNEENLIPRLCLIVCWSAIDAAIHDGWARASGMSAYVMYNEEHLNEDLSSYLGKGWARLYPQSFLRKPETSLHIQHVVGGSDPLTDHDAGNVIDPADDLPVTLEQWIAKEGFSWLKIKLSGKDSQWDIRRIVDVHRVAVSAVEKHRGLPAVKLTLDANEGCSSPEQLIETLIRLKFDYPHIYHAIQYLEQPTARDLQSYSFSLHQLGELKPVMMDESLDSLDKLPYIDEQGWSGIALKTGRGHSQSLLAYCWAKKNNKHMTMQDLTNPGIALVHSANLCSHLALSYSTFEHNSRQYIPTCGWDELEQYPNLRHVDEGQISLRDMKHFGLY
jgi:L-alanine-DL-glutamate epimerase-like enolase superfamily enzyme